MLKETVKRLKTKTPKYFVKIRGFGLTLVTIGGALLVPDIAHLLPLVITQYAGYAVAIGTAIASIATLPVIDPNKNISK